MGCDIHAHAEVKIKEKNAIYAERNMLLAALAWHIVRRGLNTENVYLVKHPDEDKEWEDAWRNIVVIECGSEQMTWHIHDSELHLFKYLPINNNYKFDGHTTEEKYSRLLRCFA